MAKRIFLSDIDLSLNELLQAKLQNLAADPSPTVSRIYYNTVINRIKYYSVNVTNTLNGGVWRTVIDDLDLAVGQTPASHIIATNTALGGQHTISGAAAGHVLRASGLTTANFQQLAHSDLSGVGSNSHAAIDSHIDNIAIHRSINDTGTSNTELFSASKILQLVADLNTAVAGSLIYKGGYDAGGNFPVLDTGAPAVTQGWTYVVTVAGVFFSEAVQVGDMLISKQTNPTTLAHWTVVNKNIPDIVAASEDAAGIIQLATQAEVTTGTNNTKAITPLKLKAHLGITGTLSAARKYTQTIGDGSELTYPVTHSIGSVAVAIAVHRTASPFDEVECEIIKTSVNEVTFNFNVAPTAGQYTVSIIG